MLLGTVGGLMLVESVNAIRRTRDGAAPTLKKPGQHNWIHRLPLKVRFRASKLFVSVIPVIGLGAGIGFLSSIMGVGGGFIMVPALIYLLKVPTNVVVGTSLFQIIFVAAYTTIVHASTNYTVDVVLAFMLMIGGVAGAQYGAKAGQRLRGEQLRALLALLVLAVALRLAFDLFVQARSRSIRWRRRGSEMAAAPPSNAAPRLGRPCRAGLRAGRIGRRRRKAGPRRRGAGARRRSSRLPIRNRSRSAFPPTVW